MWNAGFLVYWSPWQRGRSETGMLLAASVLLQRQRATKRLVSDLFGRFHYVMPGYVSKGCTFQSRALWRAETMSKSIIVIGAAIAGLSTGCYGQMNGYRTQIFEMHDKPGGVCTSWKRKGYTIDGCIHWLVGFNQDSSFHHIWEEFGAVQGRQPSVSLNHLQA